MLNLKTKFYLKFELQAPYVHFLLFYKRFKTAGSRSSRKEEIKHILIYFALSSPEIFMDFFLEKEFILFFSHQYHYSIVYHQSDQQKRLHTILVTIIYKLLVISMFRIFLISAIHNEQQ
jgi:hypothetical protein